MAHGLEFFLATLQPGFEVAYGAADVFQIEVHIFASGLVVGELDEAVGPVINLFRQSFMNGGQRLVHMGDAASGDFAEVFRHEGLGGEREGAIFQPGSEPGCSKAFRQQRAVGGREGFEVEVRRPTGEGGAAVGHDADELQALGNDLTVAGFHFMREEQKQRKLVAFISRVDEDRALPKKVGVLLQ